MGNSCIKSNELSNHRRANSLLSSYSNETRHVVEPPVLIGTFNIQRFGHSKMTDPEVAEVLTKIVLRYDILLVLEIVDTTGIAIKDLLNRVNEKAYEISDRKGSSGPIYKVEVSPRLGRTKAKEQCAFFYKSARFKVKKSILFEEKDPNDRIFFREPYVVHFTTSCLANMSQSPNVEIDFSIIGIHTHPKNAAEEIDKLDEVREWAQKRLKTANVFIMGDLNASAPYVHASDWTSNRLKLNPIYNWLIPDHMDTTVHHALAAYDRIIACEENLSKLVVPMSASTFRYNEHVDFKPLSQELLFKISDHYPVEIQLKTRMHQVLQDSVQVFDQVVVLEDTRKVKSVQFTARNAEQIVSPFSLCVFYNKKHKLSMAELTAEFENTSAATTGVKKLRENSVLPYSLYALAASQLSQMPQRDAKCSMKIAFKLKEDKTTIFISQPS